MIYSDFNFIFKYRFCLFCKLGEKFPRCLANRAWKSLVFDSMSPRGWWKWWECGWIFDVLFSVFIGWGFFRNHRKIHDLLIFLQISQLFQQIFSISCFLVDSSLEHYNWQNSINLRTPIAPKKDTNCWWFRQKVDKLNGTSLPYNPTLKQSWIKCLNRKSPASLFDLFLNAAAKRVTKSVDKIQIPLIKRFLDLLLKINLPRISIQFFRVNSSMKFVSWISRHLA